MSLLVGKRVRMYWTEGSKSFGTIVSVAYGHESGHWSVLVWLDTNVLGAFSALDLEVVP